MVEVLHKKLSDEILRHAEWQDVRPHVLANVVFVVENVPLVTVGEAIATDNKGYIEGLIHAGGLNRPTADDIARWDELKTRFVVLIVAPFVLIHEEN